MEVIIDTTTNLIVKGPSPTGVLRTTAVGRRVVAYNRPALDPMTQRYGDMVAVEGELPIPLWVLADYEREVQAAVDSGQPAPAPLVPERGVVALVWPVEDLLPGEVAARQTAALEVRIAEVAMAARAYIADRLDPDGMILVDRMVRAGSAKGMAVEAWLLALRTEQYRRQALIEVGLWDDADPCDFSGYGDKPFTIPQLMMEAGYPAE